MPSTSKNELDTLEPAIRSGSPVSVRLKENWLIPAMPLAVVELIAKIDEGALA